MQGQRAGTLETKGVSEDVPFISGAVYPKPYGEEAKAWKGPKDIYWRVRNF